MSDDKNLSFSIPGKKKASFTWINKIHSQYANAFERAWAVKKVIFYEIISLDWAYTLQKYLCVRRFKAEFQRKVFARYLENGWANFNYTRDWLSRKNHLLPCLKKRFHRFNSSPTPTLLYLYHPNAFCQSWKFPTRSFEDDDKIAERKIQAINPQFQH